MLYKIVCMCACEFVDFYFPGEKFFDIIVKKWANFSLGCWIKAELWVWKLSPINKLFEILVK
jgi:hypothetical protein